MTKVGLEYQVACQIQQGQEPVGGCGWCWRPGVGFWWAFFFSPIGAAAILITAFIRDEISSRRNASVGAMG